MEGFVAGQERVCLPLRSINMVARGSDQATGICKRLEDEGERKKEKECDIRAMGEPPDKQKRSYLCYRREAKKTKRSLRKKRKKDNCIIKTPPS
jgi:hypothetical protein